MVIPRPATVLNYRAKKPMRLQAQAKSALVGVPLQGSSRSEKLKRQSTWSHATRSPRRLGLARPGSCTRLQRSANDQSASNCPGYLWSHDLNCLRVEFPAETTEEIPAIDSCLRPCLASLPLLGLRDYQQHNMREWLESRSSQEKPIPKIICNEALV